MAIVDFALKHAREGRVVFPGCPNAKTPAIPDPYSKATTSESQIVSWWQENPNYNICLPGGYEIEPGQYIGFIDVDCKHPEKNGFDTMRELDILGFEFPETLAQITPSGGLHLFYYFDFPIQNSAGLLGKGIDTRGFHGYILGAGGEIDGKKYQFKNQAQIQKAPAWLAQRCRRVDGDRRTVPETIRELAELPLIHNIEPKIAERKALRFLEKIPVARAGERNERGYKTACHLRDFGMVQEHTLECMLTHWKADPPLSAGEITSIVESAYKYAKNEIGVDAPENTFDAILPPVEPKKPKHPVDKLNETYALVIKNGVRIVRELTIEGEEHIDHLSVQAFHEVEANNLITGDDDKTVPVSKLWMRSKHRRQYDGITFAPGAAKASKRLYNLWRGFRVGLPKGPPSEAAEKAVQLFLEHIRENVCEGDQELTDWVVGFFAHLVQFPDRKPGVALVLRGEKGVGKNVITDCISRILGNHSLLAANRRYLSGNFNAHLENKLLLILDEAFWSGDKSAEGILKDLITGSTQIIERKGHEPYAVPNLMRVVILGNEEWIVPATQDERRFAVFNVGNTRQNDSEYFGQIKDGMFYHGGDELLFKYLSEFDLSKVQVNVPPKTSALISQKEHTLGLLESWWLNCLKQEMIVGSSLTVWPEEILCDVLRAAFVSEMKILNIRSRLPGDRQIGRAIKIMLPGLQKIRKREKEDRHWAYLMPPLERAREQWEKFIRGKVDWENPDS